MRALVAVALAVALSGCIQGIFVDTEQTTRRFLCGALVSDGSPGLELEVRMDPRVRVSPIESVGRLQGVLADLRNQTSSDVDVRIVDVADPPDVWDDAAWTQELDGHSFRADLRTVRLVVYWVPDLAGSVTGDVLLPGVVALDQAGLESKAVATGRPLETVTHAALLHHVGHALGAVNRGAPMQANHEGVPGHDADAADVMHGSWHDAADPTWVPGATYSDYGAATRADWSAAVNDAQVCP